MIVVVPRCYLIERFGPESQGPFLSSGCFPADLAGIPPDRYNVKRSQMKIRRRGQDPQVPFLGPANVKVYGAKIGRQKIAGALLKFRMFSGGWASESAGLFPPTVPRHFSIAASHFVLGAKKRVCEKLTASIEDNHDSWFE